MLRLKLELYIEKQFQLFYFHPLIMNSENKLKHCSMVESQFPNRTLVLNMIITTEDETLAKVENDAEGP